MNASQSRTISKGSKGSQAYVPSWGAGSLDRTGTPIEDSLFLRKRKKTIIFADLPIRSTPGSAGLHSSTSAPELTSGQAALRQNVVVQQQMARHSALGVSKALMPPCDAVYRALLPATQPSVDELLARAQRGQGSGDHNRIMLAMLLCERPPALPGQEALEAPLQAAPSDAMTAQALGDKRSELNVADWITAVRERWEGKAPPPQPRAVDVPQDERRKMSAEKWMRLMQQQVQEELHTEHLPSHIVAAEDPASDGKVDPRFVAAAILAFPRTASLILDGMRTIAPALAPVPCLKHLRRLSIRENPIIQGRDLQALAGSSLLALLDVSRCPKLDTLIHLQDLPSLVHVTAQDCESLRGPPQETRKSSKESAPVPADQHPMQHPSLRIGTTTKPPTRMVALPSLSEVELQGCPQLDRVSASLPAATCLDLSFLPSLSSVAGELAHLLQLDVSFCESLQEIPGSLFQVCPSLEELTARNCPQLTAVRGLTGALSLTRLRLPQNERLVVLGSARSDMRRTNGGSADSGTARMLCPNLRYLDVDKCPSLMQDRVWRLVKPLIQPAVSSHEKEIGVTYRMLRAEGGFQENELVEIIDYWASDTAWESGNLAFARQCMKDVQGSTQVSAERAEDATKAQARVEEAEANAQQAREAAEGGKKGAKAAKLQEAVEAAEKAVSEAKEEAARAVEAAASAAAAADAAPDNARKSAKVTFVYLFRSLASGITGQLTENLDGVAFEAVPLDTAEENGIIVVWPSQTDANALWESVGVNPEIRAREAARMKLLEAVQTGRKVVSATGNVHTRPEWRQRASLELTDALERAEGILLGGLAGDFPLLRSLVRAGLVELLPDLEVKCFLGSGISVKSENYEMHEVVSEFMRERREVEITAPSIITAFSPLSERPLNFEPKLKHSSMELGVCTCHLDNFEELLRTVQLQAAQRWDAQGLRNALDGLAWAPQLAKPSLQALCQPIEDHYQLLARLEKITAPLLRRGAVSIDRENCCIRLLRPVLFEEREKPDISAVLLEPPPPRLGGEDALDDLAAAVAAYALPMAFEVRIHNHEEDDLEYLEGLALGRANLLVKLLEESGVPSGLLLARGEPEATENQVLGISIYPLAPGEAGRWRPRRRRKVRAETPAAKKKGGKK